MSEVEARRVGTEPYWFEVRFGRYSVLGKINPKTNFKAVENSHVTNMTSVVTHGC